MVAWWGRRAVCSRLSTAWRHRGDRASSTGGGATQLSRVETPALRLIGVGEPGEFGSATIAEGPPLVCWSTGRAGCCRRVEARPGSYLNKWESPTKPGAEGLDHALGDGSRSVAEREGFEPPGPFEPAAFKAAAFVRSATVPETRLATGCEVSQGAIRTPNIRSNSA